VAGATGQTHHMTDRLLGKRVLVTSADRYMGSAIVDLFRSEGASVVADARPLVDPHAPAACIADAGEIDIMIANLGVPALMSPVTDMPDDGWLHMFDELVHPLMRLVRSALPGMIERGSGKIVAITSSSPLRPIRHATAYASARAAQNTFVRYVGVELASRNVQVNAIAQNYIANPTYYPPELVATERFRSHLHRSVPADRLGLPSDTAELALFLASGASDFICGQVVPLDGGWSA
jgi:2-keto-3-deoxy-L-fuconate dehydrogenase